ncbi:hypothetical protein [Herbaspirillum sp.]|uniref:hypothetical protein n=1 Tax=Herbaspirillum sp. TaxID=1890675 RepID=UPI000C0B9264|nr:hypothetical protein [Herbaspirillum sp.]MAF04404.1 hypothetical protein [Herbaspirillum sp.]|tara:strand:- start:36738 stop:37241 length:504 start_codon:yes stop_codon:yes gene_type:complete
MNLIEKYTQSVGSSNLRDDEHHHSTEVLAAVAMSGDLASLLFRVKYYNDATSYSALSEGWHNIVLKKSQLRKWPEHIKAKKIADLSLKHWLNDICEACGGRGVEKHENGPYISDVPCKVCKGTARKAVACDRQSREFVEDMVADLDEQALRAGAMAMRKLAKQMELP